MGFLNNDKYKNILAIITLIKFGVLLLLSIVIMNNWEFTSEFIKMSSTSLFILTSMVFFLIAIYFIWSYIFIKTTDIKKVKMMLTIENYIYIMVLSFFIYLSGSYESHYKFLFLFCVITPAIALGKKAGIISSSICSTILLFIDLVFVKNTQQVNVYFQNDLLLCAAFIFLAWIIGEYVMLEEDQRQSLQMELSEQLKRHDYIEEMLLANDACYNILFKQSPDAIIIHNSKELFYLNENALKLVGFSSFTEFNKQFDPFMNGNRNESLKDIYVDILSNQETEICFEEKITSNEGIILDIQNTSSYCIYEKKPAILTIMRDITTEKQVQQLKKDIQNKIELLNESKEYNRVITEFFTNISHELKTPLNVIFSSMQLLTLYNENNNEEVVEKKKGYLIITKQNCYRLLRLIDNILDITKLDAGFITTQMENADIINTVEELTLSIVPYAENKGINIIFDTDVEEKVIAFDPDKMERIILNLLSNALKFTESGGDILVNITDGQDVIILSVKDSGIGIPEDKLESIFERFMQVDKSLRRNNEGSGIGLSLVKSFVELQGGTIEVKSKINYGSEFIITLPSKQTDCNNFKSSEIRSDLIEMISLELSDIYSDVANDTLNKEVMNE